MSDAGLLEQKWKNQDRSWCLLGHLSRAHNGRSRSLHALLEYSACYIRYNRGLVGDVTLKVPSTKLSRPVGVGGQFIQDDRLRIELSIENCRLLQYDSTPWFQGPLSMFCY